MISSLCFLVVNITLFIMLGKIASKKGSIDLMFLICLIFTYLGNVSLGLSFNTFISLINAVIGIKIFKL